MTYKWFVNYLKRAFVLVNVAFENNEDNKKYKKLRKYYYSKIPSKPKEIKAHIKGYEDSLIKYFAKISQDCTNEKIIDKISNSNLNDGNIEIGYTIVQITSYLETDISKKSKEENAKVDSEINNFINENETTNEKIKMKLVEISKAYFYL